MQIIIRESQESDYYTIGSLIKNELGYGDLDLDKLAVRLQLMKSNPNHMTFVAVHNEKIVGFIGLCKGIAYEFDGEYLRIIALAVSKELQRQGIGSQLLKEAEAYAAELNIHCFALNSGLRRTATHVFYEHNGYIKRSYGFSKDI